VSVTLDPQPLRFAGEYGAESPLWASGEGRMVAVEELPVSLVTRRRLMAWAQSWEQMTAPGVLVDGPPPDPAEFERLEAEAESLRQQLESELGPAWTVTRP
jgi:hypothetical protein